MVNLRGDYYTAEEYRSLRIIVNYPCRRCWLLRYDTDLPKIKRFFASGMFYWGDERECRKDGEKVHTTLYKIHEVLYRTLYEDLPTMIGYSNLLDQVIKWRLKIGR